MEHFRDLSPLHLEGAWVTIGSFDGVHLGHRRLLSEFVAEAREANAPAVVITFYPHPAEVLGKVHEPFYLSTPEEKAALIANLGVDVMVTHPFNQEVARLSAEEFMERVHRHLGLQRLWVGYDFALGRNREGNITRLRQIGARMGYTLVVFPPYEVDGGVVSSSRIRRALGAGDVEKAARMLGRLYTVPGEVVHGDGRGRGLGFPTANLAVWEKRMVPASGVYAAFARVGNEVHPAVVNIGVRPTFEERAAPRVEAHLIGYKGDLYGEKLVLEFVKRLRAERKFPSAEALRSQIERDVAQAQEILSNG